MRPEKLHAHIFRPEMVIPGAGRADMW